MAAVASSSASPWGRAVRAPSCDDASRRRVDRSPCRAYTAWQQTRHRRGPSAAGRRTTMAISQEAPTLPLGDPASLGLDPERIERLCRLIEGHIAEGHYPGAQIAFARHGKLGFVR